MSFYTRALLLLRRPPCWNKQGAARHVVTSRLARPTWRDAESGIWPFDDRVYSLCFTLRQPKTRRKRVKVAVQFPHRNAWSTINNDAVTRPYFDRATIVLLFAVDIFARFDARCSERWRRFKVDRHGRIPKSCFRDTRSDPLSAFGQRRLEHGPANGRLCMHMHLTSWWWPLLIVRVCQCVCVLVTSCTVYVSNSS